MLLCEACWNANCVVWRVFLWRSLPINVKYSQRYQCVLHVPLAPFGFTLYWLRDCSGVGGISSCYHLSRSCHTSALPVLGWSNRILIFYGLQEQLCRGLCQEHTRRSCSSRPTARRWEVLALLSCQLHDVQRNARWGRPHKA
jgi:hypothetical protein